MPLVTSDLDGTLIPLQPDEEARVALARIRDLVAAGRFRLAYVTGRHLEHAVDGVHRFGLPIPVAIGSAVGTSVHWLRDGVWVADADYERSIATMPGLAEPAAIRSALRAVSPLRLQGEAEQARFKVSYTFDGVLSDDLLASMGELLAPVGRTRLVASRDPVTGDDLLDVLPADVGKETAVRHLEARLHDGAERVVFAGDSGNDRSALLMGTRSIVVGNAAPKLRAELRALADEGGLGGRVFFARAHYAAGVLEGLRYHGVGH